MQEMIFQASQGYPMPECLCYNTADLRMLTEFYSGRTSELTTTMQYSYQSTILSSCRPEIAEAIGKINMVEMRHISLLGRCITMMGGDPQFIRPAQKQYWHAGLVNYATDSCCMLLGDMRAELMPPMPTALRPVSAAMPLCVPCWNAWLMMKPCTPNACKNSSTWPVAAAEQQKAGAP